METRRRFTAEPWHRGGKTRVQNGGNLWPEWKNHGAENVASGSQSILVEVSQIISERLNVNTADITFTTKFVDDLGADSFDLVGLVLAFEEAFEIEISDDDAEKMRTVGDALSCVRRSVKR